MSSVEAVSENNPWKKLNTCPLCGHYDWHHELEGCKSMALSEDKKSIVTCTCKVPFGGKKC